MDQKNFPTSIILLIFEVILNASWSVIGCLSIDDSEGTVANISIDQNSYDVDDSQNSSIVFDISISL